PRRLDYPAHVPSLFRRRSTTDPASDRKADTASAADTSAASQTAGADTAGTDTTAPTSGRNGAKPRAGIKPKAYTPGKGRPTPKRRDARKRLIEPPPKDRKEAMRRLRERQRQERAEARRAMLAGDERYLPPRDRGPERRLVRNIVDARRNVGTWFFGIAIVILVVSSIPVPPQVRLAVDVVWVATLIAIVIDSFLLSRLVKRLVSERFPKTQKFGGLYFYAIMRSLTLRRMRIPLPQVKPG